LLSHPEVQDAVSFGERGEIWEELLISAVVLNAGASATPQALLQHCRNRLEAENVPDEIHIVADLPRGPAGKPLIEGVRDLVGRARSPGAGVDALRQEVYRVAAACFAGAPEELSPAATPETVPGWNSLAHLQLAAALEERFGFALSPRDIMNMETMGEVERVVRARLAA
jgi:acyl carrier protein